jgi:uncharacterized protein
MPTATAIVLTEVPDRYAKQLLAHLGRKPAIELRAETLIFGYGTATVRAKADRLVLRVEAADAESLARLEDVVARHLIRFGRRAELTVTWQSDA